jgi:hypothetical protein
MTLDTALFDSNQVCLEIPQTAQDEAWRQSQSFSSSSSRWNAYLNQICLNAILPWLQEEYSPQAAAWPNAAVLPSFWEVVNGTAIALDAAVFTLIPIETIDLNELRVPQEWVDIPGWAADYYLAAQVNPDDRWVRIAGYCTHQQLKAEGSYDTSDRTYYLDEDNLTKDLNVLWVARQLCPDEPTKSAISPLPALPLAQAENLLQRLGNSDVVTPRLAVPFELWGALLEHGAWRQRLYQRRLGLPEQWSVLQWISSGVSELTAGLGWGRLEFQSSLAGARGTEAMPALHSILSRQLIIAGQPYELRVIPQGNPEEMIWRFELRNASSQENGIPAGFKLRLLTEDLQPFENNEDIATTTVDQLYVEVMLAPGEGLVWEIEPVPENYDREILRF